MKLKNKRTKASLQRIALLSVAVFCFCAKALAQSPATQGAEEQQRLRAYEKLAEEMTPEERERVVERLKSEYAKGHAKNGYALVDSYFIDTSFLKCPVEIENVYLAGKNPSVVIEFRDPFTHTLEQSKLEFRSVRLANVFFGIIKQGKHELHVDLLNHRARGVREIGAEGWIQPGVLASKLLNDSLKESQKGLSPSLEERLPALRMSTGLSVQAWSSLGLVLGSPVGMCLSGCKPRRVAGSIGACGLGCLLLLNAAKKRSNEACIFDYVSATTGSNLSLPSEEEFATSLAVNGEGGLKPVLVAEPAAAVAGPGAAASAGPGAGAAPPKTDLKKETSREAKK